MKIILICGYKMSGKDSLYKDVVMNEYSRWLFYKNPAYVGSSIFLNQGLPSEDQPENNIRFAFADVLKLEVIENVFGKELLANDILPFLEQNKDKFVIPHTGKTFRQHCIDLSFDRKRQDVHYWVDFVLNQIKKCKTETIWITDWRFLHEIERVRSYCIEENIELITVRVYRPTVCITSSILEPSEHELDFYPTDYLAINKDADDPFELSIKTFVQYERYLPV